MNNIIIAVKCADIDSITIKYYGKPRLTEANNIGYPVTSQIIKICFGILQGQPFSTQFHDPINKIDINNDESIARVFEMYKDGWNDLSKQLRSENIEIDADSIYEIRELLNRIINYINKREVLGLFRDSYILGDDLFTLYISKNNVKLQSCSDEMAYALDFRRDIIKEKAPSIKKWRIYNPRLDEEWICDLQESVELYHIKVENQRREEIRIRKEFESQFDSLDIDIEPFEFDMLYNEMFDSEEGPDENYVFDHVKEIRNKLDIPFKDAFYLFADDFRAGRKHTKNDFVFRGQLYTSKNELYREMFPEYTTDSIHHAVKNKMKHHGISWEEAVESVINDPPENRNKEIVYHGKKYKSKKNLFKVLFPNKRYESISASISILMNNESLSFEDAISRYKEKGKPSNIKKEIDYNGKHYHSLREACKELGLKPESVSYYAKHSFRNNYSKAIDYLLHQNEN